MNFKITVKHVNKKSKHRQSLYSIEFGPSVDTIRSRTDTILDYDIHMGERDVGELSPKPMTPRRVKRRSVMARGSNSRHSTTSRRAHGAAGASGSRSDVSQGSATGTNGRSSTRSSRRKYQQNPVTKLLDQQQLQLQQQQHHGHQHHHQAHQPAKQQFGSFQRHSKDSYGLTESNLQTLNQELMNKTLPPKSATIVSSLTKTNNNQYHAYRKNIPPDPIYYNTNAQTGLYQHAWQASSQSPIVGSEEISSSSPTMPPPMQAGGHFNPSYQHSTNNIHEAERVDELYNNRPPSVRSSYSNFHGARPLSSYMPNCNTNTENVFVGLPGAAQKHPATQTDDMQYQLQHVPPSTPPLYQQHPLQPLPPPPPIPSSISQQHLSASVYNHAPNFHNVSTSTSQNIPFNKQRTASRESIRSMAFLNNGPPAYNLNYHTPPDSETTM